MSNETVRKGYHCAWQIHYHIVFPVKYRKALLESEVTDIIQKTASGLAERYPIEMEAIGYDKDHIHLLCGAHPKLAPGKIVHIFKSITAREIFQHKPSVKKELWGGEFWTDGYYVATVGERANWDTVEQYIQKQGKPQTELKQLKLFD
jgi:putative transposase